MTNPLLDEALKTRKADHPIQSFILGRWSPRAMTGESIEETELMSLFEAARWAPSSYNDQPTRFLYAKRDTPVWSTFFNLLIDFNQQWVKQAAVLIAVTSRQHYEQNNKPSPTHQFDAGAAWMCLALEGLQRGLVVHGMSGFDYEKARLDLKVPKDYDVLAMIAIGKPAHPGTLPEGLRQKETPSGRKPLSSLIIEGTFS